MSNENNPTGTAAPGQGPRDIHVVPSGADPAFAALQGLFDTATPPVSLHQGESLAQVLETTAEGPVLVIRKAPVLALAESMHRGAAPSAAAAACQEELEGFLAAARRARSRVLALDETSLSEAPADLISGLEQRLGVSLSGADLPARDAGTADPGFVLCQALAAQILGQARKLRSLSDQVVAMTLGMQEDAPLDLALLDQGLDQGLARGGIGAEQEERAAEETSALLGANIAELREQVEKDALDLALAQKSLEAAETRSRAEAATARDREARLGAALLRFGRSRDEHGAANARLREANGGLQQRVKVLDAQCAEQDDQLARAEARLKELAATISEDTTAREDLQRALDETRAELDHVYNSKSWKLATAMRRVRHGFRE